ncbi:hypothetical protein [Actinoplanes sp. GCM10030250]|uniref:hypothetical protein n=1 Tax=Actinoplanes sp. GCM10030250 TaxID=3273376 RepID=UPI00360769CD
MVRWDRRRWSNWAGDVIVERPERRYYPGTREDLIAIIGDAERQQPPQRVRASGSHWSFSDIAVSPDWFVETHDLRATLYDVIPAALTARARQELLDQDGAEPVHSYYHVEAGITIHDLNLRLDRRDLPKADREWARMPVDAITGPWPGANKRWALPTMGGAAGQTLAGAISTGVHGGDHDLPPMADMIVAVHLIGTGGQQWWIERDTAITDPGHVRRLLPGVEYRACTELFDAVLVSAGRMGIVYAYVVRVVEQFGMEQTTRASTWEDEAAGLRPPFGAFQDTRFLEALLVPYADRHGRHTCHLTTRRTIPVPEKGTGPHGPDFFGLLCRHSTITPVVLVLIAVTVLAMAVSWLIPVIGPILVSLEGLILLGLLGLLIFARGSLGDLVARACNLANRLGRSALVRRAIETVFNRFRPSVTQSDVGYELMDLSETGGDCYRADPMEVFFDAATGAHADFLEQDVFPAFVRSAKAGRTVAGYVSLRFTRRSSALLAMQQGDPTASIEIALLKGVEGNTEILHALQAAALRRGATIHWGQRNTIDAAAVAAGYPRLGLWRKRLAEVIGDGNPGTFDNAYCAARGLEP